MSEIQNTIINGIAPTGNVNIQVLKGNKCVRKINWHNTGTIELCKYLRDSLIGTNIIAYRPGRIVPCKKEGADLVNLFEYGVQYLPEAINNKSDDGSQSAWLDMGFIIPNTLLPAGSTVNGFKLCRNILDESGKLVEYAIIDLTNINGVDNSITIPDNKTSIRVDWRIKISIVDA